MTDAEIIARMETLSHTSGDRTLIDRAQLIALLEEVLRLRKEARDDRE